MEILKKTIKSPIRATEKQVSTYFVSLGKIPIMGSVNFVCYNNKYKYVNLVNHEHVDQPLLLPKILID